MDLTFLGLGGGVTQNPCPPDPPPVKLRKLKWGLKDRKENKNIWFYQNQTDTNLYGR